MAQGSAEGQYFACVPSGVESWRRYLRRFWMYPRGGSKYTQQLRGPSESFQCIQDETPGLHNEFVGPFVMDSIILDYRVYGHAAPRLKPLLGSGTRNE